MLVYKNKKKMSTPKKVIIAICTVIVVLVLAGFCIFKYLFSDLTINSITDDISELGITTNSKDLYSSKDIVNIALFGLDGRDQAVDSGRSDSIMIVSLNKSNKNVKLISILRDSYVAIDGHGHEKINHAYAYGGPVLAIKTINQNFNMNIKDYVTANFAQFASVVDAVGGVMVDITESEMAEINNNSTQKLNTYGTVHLNGEQALAYSRIRNLDGDSVRANRQKKVIESIASSLKSSSMTQYIKLVRSVMPMLETSLSYNDIIGLYPFLSYESIDETTVPGPQENAIGGMYEGAWVYRYDLNAASDRIYKFICE